jgi:hypothetical protein
MSDEQLYGQDHTEASTFGGSPIHPETPPEDVLTPSEAVEKISEPRPESVPLVERDYINPNKRARNEDGTFAANEDGAPLFERVPSRDWVTAEEAGQDLAATRQAEADYLKNQEAEQIRKATDELRSGQPQQPQQPTETVDQWAERLQQQQPVQPTNDDVITQLRNAIAQTDSALQNTSDLILWRDFRPNAKPSVNSLISEFTKKLLMTSRNCLGK